MLVVSPVTKFAGKPTKESLRLGVRMNCRGVTELVVASVGLQYHLIRPRQRIANSDVQYSLQ